MSMASLSVDSIKQDLESEVPMWPLSSFGPAKHQPNLVGPLDDSPEELRVKAAQAAKAGTTQDYVSVHSLCVHLFPWPPMGRVTWGEFRRICTLRDTQLYAIS